MSPFDPNTPPEEAELLNDSYAEPKEEAYDLDAPGCTEQDSVPWLDDLDIERNFN